MNLLVEKHSNADLFLLNKQFEHISSRRQHSVDKLLSAQLSLNKEARNNTSALLHELDRRNEHPEQTFVYVTNRLQQLSDSKPIFLKEYQWRVKTLASENKVGSAIKVDVFYETIKLSDTSGLHCGSGSVSKTY